MCELLQMFSNQKKIFLLQMIEFVNEFTYLRLLWSPLWTKSKFLHYSDPFLPTDDSFFPQFKITFALLLKNREYSPDIFFS